MELYLDSLRRNPTIDFLFITDCDDTILKDIPNISYQKIAFEDYILKYKKILGSSIQINNPYKICDLRPFFALAHKQDIEGYDFFGWADTDLLFGDLRSFYTSNLLERYNVLSTHSSRLSGHCALLRNTSKHQSIGFKIYRWKEALENPQFVGIDEHGITNALQMTIWDKIAEKFKFSKDNPFCNFMRKWKISKHYFVEQYTTPFTPIPWLDGSLHDNQPSNWYYDRGEITNDTDLDRKFIYLHLMNFKSRTWRLNQTEAPWENNDHIYEDIDVLKRVNISRHGFKNVLN